MTLCLCRDLHSEFIKKMQIVFFEDECVAVSHKALRCLDNGGRLECEEGICFLPFGYVFMCKVLMKTYRNKGLLNK